MNLKSKLLSLDIAIFLIFSIIYLIVKDLGRDDLLSRYFIPFMLTAYLIGRHLPLKIVKKHLDKNNK